MNLKEIKKELPLDETTGKKIADKVLWATLIKMEDEHLIEKVPSMERTPSYQLTKKFRTKEYNQIIILDKMKNKEFLTDTINFQHTIYGMPQFEKISKEDHEITLKLIHQLDEALTGLMEIKNRNMHDNDIDEIVLLSTIPVKKTREVRDNIELLLNIYTEDNIYLEEKYENILAYGNICKYADIINTGLICQSGRWINNIITKKKFLYHKLLNKFFSKKEIEFMLSIIRLIVSGEIKNFNIYRRSELEQFVIYMGFQKPNNSFSGGIWYEEKNDYFYNVAKIVTKKIDEKEFCNLQRIDRVEKIKEIIQQCGFSKENSDNHLAFYIEAKSYFEKIKPLTTQYPFLINSRKDSSHK